MVVPNISVRYSVIERSYGVMPVVDVVKTITMTHTPTWKPDKFRMQVRYSFREVGTKSVLMSLESILREKADHVK